MSIGRTVILLGVLIAMAAPSARASHAHLNYPDWWKPVKQVELTAPPIQDAEPRRQAFAERNNDAAIEALGKEFFGMININALIMRPAPASGFSVMDTWGRYASRPDSDVYVKNTPPPVGVRDLVQRQQYRKALELYKDNFFERLIKPPEGFLLTARHPRKRIFMEFVHQPDELMHNIVTLFMYQRPQDDETENGIVVKLNIGEPGAINCTYTPEGYGSAEETLFDDARFAARAYSHDFFFDQLLIAYVETGDPTYIEKYAQFLDDRALNLWNDVRANGIDLQPGRENIYMFQHMSWACRYVPGFREHFPAPTLARLLIQFWKHTAATEVKIVRGTVTNRQIGMYLNEAWAAAVSFPEFWAGDYVKRERLRVNESVFACDVMPDGSNIEHNLGYNTAVLELWKHYREIRDAGILLRHASWDWALELQDNLTVAVRYLLQNKVLNGWDWYSMHYHNRGKRTLIDRFEPAYADPIIRKALPTAEGRGPVNGRPNVTSLAWPYMGIYILRTGWDQARDQECYMAAPRPYSTHNWKNNLDLQLFGFGQPLLTAHSEYYGYVRGPGQTNWETSFREKQYKKYDDNHRRGMHQWDFTPVFVDGCPQLGHAGFASMPDEYQDRPGPRYGHILNRAYYTPQPNRWHESDYINIMEGAYDGPFAEFVPNPDAGIGFQGKPGEVKRFIDDVTHKRQVILLKQLGLWIITDRLSSPAEHNYNLDWKFAQEWWNKDPDKDQVPGFDRSEIAFEPERNGFVTHDPKHANLSLYMNSAADMQPVYAPETNHYGANFSGKGEMLIHIRSADGGERGFALGLRKLHVNGLRQDLGTQDAEFTLKENRLVNIRPVHTPLGLVKIHPEADVFTDQVEISLLHPSRDIDIRYTLDGTDPDLSSPLYTGPFRADSPTVVAKVRGFRKGLTEIPDSPSETLATSISRATYRKVEWKTPGPMPKNQGLNAKHALGYGYLSAFTPMVTQNEQRSTISALFEGVEPNHESDFMIEYWGALVVPRDGIYTIHAPMELIDYNLDSGYDLRLWLDNGRDKKEWYPATRIQNFGGWSVALQKGAHPLRILYIDQRGGNLEESGRHWPGKHPVLEISGPGFERQPIPSAWLRR